MAFLQVPPLWLVTNAWKLSEPSRYRPPTVQLPAAAHDTEVMRASPSRFRAAVPGTSMAFPQVPPGPSWPMTRRVPATAPAALAPPAAGPSSTAAAPATTAARRIRLPIATPHPVPAHAGSGAGDRGKPGSTCLGERRAETNHPPIGSPSVTRAREPRQGPAPV